VLLAPFDTPADPRPLDRGVAFLRALAERADARLYAAYWFMGGLSQQFVAEHFDEVEGWIERRVARDPFLRADPARTSRWMEVLRRGWIDEDALTRLAVPVSLLAPTRNAWHAGPTVEMAESLARRIPNAEVHRLEGYGSLVPLEAPQRVVESIAAFLERVSCSMQGVDP
jgi:pimeloyl-ACP methyl ester carboxylesterase